MAEKRVLLAAIGAPHGIAGEVRLKTFTEDPLAVVSYRDVEDADGRAVRISSGRALKDDLIVARIDGITTRDGAEAIRGVQLFLPRARLPETEDDETFYHADLIGLAVVTEDERPFGRIANVVNYGAGDLLDIVREGRRSGELVPFTRENVPVVDIPGGRIVLRPPEGVFEEPEA